MASVKCACGLGLPKRGAWWLGGVSVISFAASAGLALVRGLSSCLRKAIEA